MIRKIINSFIVFYSPKYPEIISYMLQASEYRGLNYLVWFWKTTDFSKVEYRKKLEKTKVAIIIYNFLTLAILIQILIGIYLIYLNIVGRLTGGWAFGLGIIVLYPVLWSQIIVIPVFFARILIINPYQKRLSKKAKKIFADHKGIKIAVAGSYGKTSLKEFLFTVLGSQFNVAMTPKNKNVALSHAQFALGLNNKEDILIVEFGEGEPGDIKRFSEIFKPDIGIITGLSPVHQDKYKSVDAAAKDLFTLEKYVAGNKLFVNNQSKYIKKYIKKSYSCFNEDGIADYRVKKVSSTEKGISFDLVSKKETLKIKSKLLGRHQIGPLCLVAYLGLDFGMEKEDIQKAILKIEPYEHRMQAYTLNGATIIDDSYNGNIEGLRAGLELLRELKFRKKIYVTPGLVDQGSLTKEIHQEIGHLIAGANPDQVVLINNSVTHYIQEGLTKAGFKNDLVIEKDPLFYYNNLADFVAKGDLVLIQNDWTDNYL
ncbi:MAG: Mur ligase family protein [Patescibacteria group bacterium]|jgi:UDP-N-acetylmuramoyl-tripeptide--D-alanyl-D-alanine ligase|nr:Mur ligase family protein [Patescibacteria group bacterium]